MTKSHLNIKLPHRKQNIPALYFYLNKTKKLINNNNNTSSIQYANPKVVQMVANTLGNGLLE